MDEGTAPGRIEKLTTPVSYMAGFNLRMLLIVQSTAQLREPKLYGEHGTQNILSNCALKVMYKPNDYNDADEYSKLLGTKTVRERTSKTMGKGRTDTTQTQNSRALMMAQELLAMPDTEIIIRYDQAAYPISAKKNCYYKDKRFLHFKKLGKLKPKATIFNNDSHSGSPKVNNSNPPQQRHYDELRRQHPQEFSHMYYGKLRHIVVEHAEAALCETLYN
ncbi:MAG: type IV secretory system conjugative DNA transfer family protein, partial [Neisseriaceae bacterium]|nr:type IV secretory system conjugative DNA transfer family protein [Neisseriaceae bacterium]